MIKRVVIRNLIGNRWHTKLLETGEYNSTQGLCRNLGVVAAQWIQPLYPKGKRKAFSFENPAEEGLVELASWRGTFLPLKVTVCPL